MIAKRVCRPQIDFQKHRNPDTTFQIGPACMHGHQWLLTCSSAADGSDRMASAGLIGADAMNIIAIRSTTANDRLL